MTKHEFYILNDLYNGRQGRGGCTSDIDRTRALDDQAAINALTDAGLIDSPLLRAAKGIVRGEG